LAVAALTAITFAQQQGAAKSPANQAGTSQAASKPKLYNTAKQKLLDGKQVFSFTQYKDDVADYCEHAKHYDYAWFEMQHSTLEFKDIEKMIAACPHAGASPMIRLPDAQEWHIQHATDIGALGVIVPTVDDVDRAREAAKWSHYPPMGRRSSGMRQADGLWDPMHYHDTINDNMLVVVMVETPTGVANAYDIASVPGVDVVIMGNGDLTYFSGYKRTDDYYHELVQKTHDAVLRAGKIFGQADARFAKGPYSADSYFFQNGPSNDGWVPPNSTPGSQNAVPKGEQ
jgi:2-keto-3-deoxy-L-rhamnonate aldolase RhmA